MRDLEYVHLHRIGQGKIGGKAAGMERAWKILKQEKADDPVDFGNQVVIPTSYFIGADVFHDFLSLNGLLHTLEKRHETREEMEADYSNILAAYKQSRLPERVIMGLRQILSEIGSVPLIVRSSSLLEDNFGVAMAGKYESVFCPNQGSFEQNLTSLIEAIVRVYASTLNPDAIMYRQQRGLLDYDERMAVLIQQVQGFQYRSYFFPSLAGVAISRNPFRWTSRIRREDGLVRMVWGLGTRAVKSIADDYPRLVALSHPDLRPEKTAEEIRYYSQHLIDLIDLTNNRLETLSIYRVVDSDYPALRLIASQCEGYDIQPAFLLGSGFDIRSMVITFDGLLRDTTFAPLMKAILRKLEKGYGQPVSIEFTADIVPKYPDPQVRIHLLQCRPFSSQEWAESPRIPSDVPEADKIFSASKLIPQGIVSDIRYIIYIDPKDYARIPERSTKLELGRMVGLLNKTLEGQQFILMGPGRWGSTNVDLGVKVTYADIYNAKVLGEISLARGGVIPEVSYGTHFFLDLVESGIYPLPLYPDEPGNIFKTSFFLDAPSVLEDLLPPRDTMYVAPYVKVIDVPMVAGGRFLQIAMDGEREKALGYLSQRTDSQTTR